MRKLGLVLILLQFLTLPAFAQTACSLCAGLVGGGGDKAPALVQLAEEEYAAFTPAVPRNVSVIVAYDAASVEEIERKTGAIIEWARTRGPFDALGVDARIADPALRAYAVKRLAVTAQGVNAASRIIVKNGDALVALFANGAGPYFDAVVTDAGEVEAALLTIAENDPSKKIYAITPVVSPNGLFDLARALGAGATRAYAASPLSEDALAQFNRSMSGDWAFDATAKITTLDAKGAEIEMPVLSFVRGEDLRSMLIARGASDAATILALDGARYVNPRRVDAAGERAIADSAVRGNRLLVGTPPAREPFGVVVDYAEPADANITRETLDIATERGIPVEEIIRNHQAYEAFQDSIQPRYIARNTTKLRFDIGGGAEALEATIAGDFFSDPSGRADWVWSDFLLNGVRWKYGKIPELPLIQPEKVTQLPLDIHLTNDYRYELVRTADVLGYRVYEVRFEPPKNAPEGLPLYRGTVWIDARTWARIRISMVQLNLGGEVLSNEERVDFTPFARDTKQQLTSDRAGAADPRSLIWLPRLVQAQQVISAVGRASVVQRETTFEDFRIEPADYETLLAQVSQSDALMTRETEAGLRYLEKRDGERVVKEGFDTAQTFLLGGIHHDPGLEYPVVPLGGIDYFNFDLWGKGIQTNVFFAGAVLAVNATHPDVGGTRTNVGFDFFGIAVPTENTMYRDGEERPEEGVKSLPVGFYVRAGRPLARFGKIDISLGVSHQTYQRAEDTASDFAVPSDTFTLTPGIEFRYARRGWSFSASYDYNRRSEWEPWGNLTEYDPEQKSFERFGASLGKSFYLPKFQRIGVDLNYLDGNRLDRFSKYELGFFGSQRVHGVESGSVRAEKAIIGHLSYGFVFSEQFRLEAFYDHALLDDDLAGYEREPFQGVGIAGQTIGPWGTLLRLDIGKTIGRNAQDGFVANVVFLKLF